MLAGCQPAVVETPISADWGIAPLPLTSKKNPAKISLDQTASIPATRIEGSGEFIDVASTRRKEARAVAGSGQGVTLNFVNVPVQQAAKIVLGDIVGVDYVLDPKIEGKISIHTPEAVERGKALDLFRAALRTVNTQVVDTGGIYKVVLGDQAATLGKAFHAGEGEDRSVGDHASIIELHYVSASEMKRLLEPIGPKGGLIQADDARRIITVAGSPQEIATMKEAVRLFDVDTMRGMSFSVVPVHSSDPDTIAENLKNVFGSELDGPMRGMVRFVPNKGLKSILIISPQPQYMARAEDWIRRLDAQAAGGEKQLYTYAVQNRPAKELAEVLNASFAAEAGTGKNNRQVAPRQPTANLTTASIPAGGGGPQLASTNVGAFGALVSPSARMGDNNQLMFPAPPQGAGAQFDPAIGRPPPGDDSRIRISADDANNSLVFVAAPDDYRRLLRAAQNLDVRPNQVLLEATIAEVSLNDQLKFGVQWYLAKKASSATFTDLASGAISSAFPAFSYALKLSNVQVTLDALQEVTDVNVISSPSLMVMDNRTATLQVGDQVPITTQSAVSVVSTLAPVVNSVTYKDTGIILAITPRINDNGRVMLDIEQEVSTVVPTTSSTIDSPTIQQRRIRTSVVVNDRESLTLGGLVQNKQSLGRNQIPALGDIPLVGNAFKTKNDLSTKTELIIIITPRVVRDTAEAQQVTDEFRRRLHFDYPRTRVSPRNVPAAVQRTLD